MAKTLAAHGPEILEAALVGLESQREKLEAQIAHVRSLLGRRTARGAAAPEPVIGTGKRELSPEARKRIAAAQKKRWAAFRKNKK